MWQQIDCEEDRDSEGLLSSSVPVETKREIEKLDRWTYEFAMSRRFYVGVESPMIVGGSSVYIYVFYNNEVGRFAFHGGFGIESDDLVNDVKRFLRIVMPSWRYSNCHPTL